MPGQRRVRRSDEIAADLRRRIQAGDFTHGLPSERDLRSEYGVSKETLRNALLVLDAEGLLVRRSGDRHRVRLASERTVVDMDIPGPWQLTVDVADDTERARLGLVVGAWVIHLWDLSRLDAEGRPTLWETLPAAGTVLRGMGPVGEDPA